ncbi:exodeoxyribonuclease VII small subunit [Haloechinothrix sp. YIM 98757]|uniref:Exodeoxyribonuclease 7 small subunit n=1 Tax=Haloechinothrix aidingensis TaxID=2752311 RepID=A0A838A809_9PSEU|nr:exodeoxyribonuclease VII small subunit [Haloechinothrix aidingensis]MBA0125408.1 exodeoxyribonuclease VII small subunit [Haloechinothrix aidingensis]
MSDDETAHPEPGSTEDAGGLGGLGYEQARDQLIEVVQGLEAGGLSLEQSLALWEKGEALAQVCERHLDGARQRIDAALASVEDTEGGTETADTDGADTEGAGGPAES